MERASVVFNTIGYILITFLAVLCLLPFLLILTGSFTAESEIIRDGFKIIPNEWSLEAYKAIFRSPEQIVKAYQVTIGLTLTGVVLGLF